MDINKNNKLLQNTLIPNPCFDILLYDGNFSKLFGNRTAFYTKFTLNLINNGNVVSMACHELAHAIFFVYKNNYERLFLYNYGFEESGRLNKKQWLFEANVVAIQNTIINNKTRIESTTSYAIADIFYGLASREEIEKEYLIKLYNIFEFWKDKDLILSLYNKLEKFVNEHKKNI